MQEKHGNKPRTKAHTVNKNEHKIKHTQQQIEAPSVIQHTLNLERTPPIIKRNKHPQQFINEVKRTQ